MEYHSVIKNETSLDARTWKVIQDIPSGEKDNVESWISFKFQLNMHVHKNIQESTPGAVNCGDLQGWNWEQREKQALWVFICTI